MILKDQWFFMWINSLHQQAKPTPLNILHNQMKKWKVVATAREIPQNKTDSQVNILN